MTSVIDREDVLEELKRLKTMYESIYTSTFSTYEEYHASYTVVALNEAINLIEVNKR